MNISEILSPKFTEFDIGTPLSKVAGAFENQELDAVVVTDGDEYRGVVSRRQLALVVQPAVGESWITGTARPDG